MKNLAGNLKGFDFKQFAIDHGEKVVGGLIGFIVILALFLGTSWKTNEKSPDELITKVNDGRKLFETSTWPVEEQEKFSTTRDITNTAKEMSTTINVAQFEPGTTETFQLIKRHEPMGDPKWEPPRQLIASSGRAFLEMLPEDALLFDGELAEDGTEMETEDSDTPAELRIKRNPSSSSEFGSDIFGDSGACPDDLGYPDDYGTGGAYPDDYGEGYDGEEGYGLTSNVKGEGKRFAAVRGVFPLRKQLEHIAKEMNEPPQSVRDLLEITDFEIQRKTRLPGDDPWAGPWETLDLEIAGEILKEVSDFEEDVVDAGITDPVVTMPLPMRIFGEWTKDVSHPLVEDFFLTEEGKEQQRLINRKLAEYEDQLIKQKESQVAKGGFARFQSNVRGMRSGLLGSGRSEYDGFYSGIQQDLQRSAPGDKDPREIVKELEERIKLSATGSLILIRYLDFTVEPGKTYKYRMRLQLLNPNYQRPIEELKDPSLALEQYRWTDWSNETGEVYIKEDAAYFVQNVDHGREGLEHDGVIDSTAVVDMFQWLPETGTHINAKLTLHSGQFVGGETKTTKIDPAASKFEDNAEVTFSTDDVVVDITGQDEVDDDLHADLEDAFVKGRSNDIGIPGEVLVMNEVGDFSLVDPLTGAANHKDLKKWVETEQEVFGIFKQQAQSEYTEGDEAGIFDDPYGEGYEGYEGSEGGEGGGLSGYWARRNRKRQRQGKNPIRQTPGQ